MDEETGLDMSGFAAELQSALDAAEQKDKEFMAPKEEPAEEEISETEELDSETEEEVSETDVDEVDKEEKEDEEFPLIPKEWTDEEKEEFESILANPDWEKARKIIIGRYDNLKKGFYKKADELASSKKEVGEWKDLFDPYVDSLKQRGDTPTSYVSKLLSVDRQLLENPEAAIKMIMEAYKVTPEKMGFGNEADDYYEDDKIARLEQKIKQLEGRGQQDKEATERQIQEANAKAIRDFRYTIDETGELKYPLFEEVKEEMAILLSKGRADSLEDAYLKSPTVKEKLAEEKLAKKSQEELAAARKKAAQVKKNSRSNKTNSSAEFAGKDTRDLRDMLTENFKNAGLL